MSDELLLQYEKELAFINQSANEFAKKHPAAASSLQITGDTVDDPLVSKLLSGVAYLNARIQQKLNDDFPELTDAILDTVYPHYLRPFPSACIVQFDPEPELDELITVKRELRIQTESFGGQICEFRTTANTDIIPASVEQASLMPRPFIAPGSNDISGAGSVLKISLKTFSNKINFSDIGLDRLRFYLRGLPQHINPLYDLIFTKSVRLVLAKNEADTNPIFLTTNHIKPVGFSRDEALIPYPSNAFDGYRLLTEYFCFPEKFLFIDFSDLAKHISDYKDELNLYIYLTETDIELENQVNENMFAMGCAPAINLFKQTADPISLDHTEYEYNVIPDARRAQELEIYSIDKVTAVNSSGQRFEYKPFYGINHSSNNENIAYWFTKRTPVIEGEHLNETASETNISFVNTNFSPYSSNNHTVEIQTTCTNRNLPKKLPTGGGQPYMQAVDASLPTKQIRCIVHPTNAIRPPQREAGYWRLISHLNLNYLSLSDGNGSTDALKEILRLYDFKNSASTRKIIDSITRIKTNPMTAPIQVDGMVSLCRGTAIQLELDQLMIAGVSTMLFTSVLERFFGLYCSINSFTRLIASYSGHDKEIMRWKPRAGEKTLL